MTASLIQGEEWETSPVIEMDGSGRRVSRMVGGPTGLRDDDSDPSARAMCGFTMLEGYFGPGTQPEIFVNSAGFLELRMFQDAATDDPGVPPARARMRCKRFTAFGVSNPASLDRSVEDALDKSGDAVGETELLSSGRACPMQSIRGAIHYESPVGPLPDAPSAPDQLVCGPSGANLGFGEPLVIGAGSPVALAIDAIRIDERLSVRSPYGRGVNPCAMLPAVVKHFAEVKCWNNTSNPGNAWRFYDCPTRTVYEDEDLVNEPGPLLAPPEFCFISGFTSPGVAVGSNPADVDFLIEITQSPVPGLSGAFHKVNTFGPVGEVRVECLPLDQTVAPTCP
ncbi:MAG TPA: hypothetical protein RMF84_00190 [Polyangiaceae bacterium LLY-WYZ-14_1]|nr:hypothetical protein [Polyangiaceae bacterium LLY-WYZ-14_1]